MARGKRHKRKVSARANTVRLLTVGVVIVGAVSGLIALYSLQNTRGNTPITSTDDIARISPQGAKDLLDRGEAVLYDARSAESYQMEHAAGAISFPEEDLDGLYRSLPSDKALIFYCT